MTESILIYVLLYYVFVGVYYSVCKILWPSMFYEYLYKGRHKKKVRFRIILSYIMLYSGIFVLLSDLGG